jgi:hypothetical protein
MIAAAGTAALIHASVASVVSMPCVMSPTVVWREPYAINAYRPKTAMATPTAPSAASFAYFRMEMSDGSAMTRVLLVFERSRASDRDAV